MEKRNRRGAAWGKIFYGRTENGNGEMPVGFNRSRRRGDDDIANSRIHFPCSEHRDRAIVVLLARVMVDHFMQRGARGHRVQQQDNAHQQGGHGRFAERNKMALYVLQIIRKLAGDVPLASDFENIVVMAHPPSLQSVTGCRLSVGRLEGWVPVDSPPRTV
jgi:hypothetical protein